MADLVVPGDPPISIRKLEKRVTAIEDLLKSLCWAPSDCGTDQMTFWSDDWCLLREKVDKLGEE